MYSSRCERVAGFAAAFVLAFVLGVEAGAGAFMRDTI
jgi:hypothetical protein